jgi:hypothetical protein
MITAHTDDAPGLPRLHVGGIDPQVRPVAFQGPVEERADALVDLRAQARYLALGYAGAAHGLHQIVDRARRHALDVRLLDHGRQRLLGQPSRFQKAREVAAGSQLRDLQFDRPGAGLPVAFPVAVALHQTGRILLTVAGPGAGRYLQFHQPLAGKADHLAQHIRVRALLQQPLQLHHLIGHRWFLR